MRPAAHLALAIVATLPLTGCARSAPVREPGVVETYRQQYVVGGRVKGLEGIGLKLRDARGAEIDVEDDGRFVFGARLDDGASYEVTVAREPIAPVQSCVVEKGVGTIAGRNAMEITVTCKAADFSEPPRALPPPSTFVAATTTSDADVGEGAPESVDEALATTTTKPMRAGMRPHLLRAPSKRAARTAAR
jgi:hypothetical protein